MDRPICIVCNKNLGERNHKSGNYLSRCRSCRRTPEQKAKKYARDLERRQERRGKKRTPHCESCGFVAVDMCQLDLDHINGDHSDNRPENLQTLCANCHRLKTKINKDWDKRTKDLEKPA